MRCVPTIAFLLAGAFALTVAVSSARARAFAATDAATIVVPGAGVSWTADDITKLRADLDTALDGAAGIAHAHVGVLAIDTATGAVLYERHADENFQPASTLKLLVGSAALERLGPEFRFHTFLALGKDTPPALVLRMGGDPTFSSSDLNAAAGALAVPAIRAAYVDDSVFDDRSYPEGWTWDDFAQDYAPRVSAATLDENVVTLSVAPGARAGDRAVVRFADGRRMWTPIEECRALDQQRVVVISRATTGPAGSDDSIDVERSAGGCPVVVGSIPLGAAPESIGAAVTSPVVAVADALERSLMEKRVAFGFTAGTGTPEGLLRPPPGTEAERVVWTHDSQPLAALLGPRFWIPSDNLFGELLLKELGLHASGKPGSTAGGIRDEKAWLAGIGVDPATLTLADGCGMSQYDRVTPRDLVAILQHDWNGPNRQTVLDSLPVGGARGTIEGINGTPAAGRVFAKTGSMMHVRGLAGYLATERHGAVTFAFNVDDWIGAYHDLAAARAAVLSRIIQD